MDREYSRGDEHGNRGFYFENLSPAEVQAVWEIGWSLAYVDAPRHLHAGVELGLNQGQPYIPIIPLEKDADKIEEAITSRAQEIEASGIINPPTADDIRRKMWGQMGLMELKSGVLFNPRTGVYTELKREY